MVKKTMFGVLALMLVLLVAPTSAQEAAPEATLDLKPMRIEIQAADGLTLVGDLYNAQLNVQTPAILLMHMLGGSRSDWHRFIPDLTAQGYRVLTVDLRGHGETTGGRDWQAAIGDTQSWLNWMHSQPAIISDRIAIVGASIGSNLALVGCAADDHCTTAVALSPAKDYFKVTTSDAMAALRQRSAFILASQRDLPSGPDVRTMPELSSGEISVHLFAGQRHGLALFANASVSEEIIDWLNGHLR